MALTYWGWEGDRDIVGRAIKPYADDKNVMPYEMEEFISAETGLRSLVRVGGDLELVRSLIAAGFPVLLEKGTFLTDLAGEFSWMGHYQLATGYDDAREVLIVQDTYVGENHEMSYADILKGWRAFNYLYLVAYPPEREAEVLSILGPRLDEAYSAQLAAQRASDEIFSAEDSQGRFFAWFNRGTSLAALQDYGGAAAAYDEAFASVYPNISQADRPWRMMWYQTGPYRAYFYSGRYYDVLNLASTTLDSMSKPVLEESFYWRALAREALGDVTGAVADLREAVRLNPNFAAGQAQLDRLAGGG
jgi:tetratricopeptide (TPR) repeat protein